MLSRRQWSAHDTEGRRGMTWGLGRLILSGEARHLLDPGCGSRLMCNKVQGTPVPVSARHVVLGARKLDILWYEDSVFSALLLSAAQRPPQRIEGCVRLRRLLWRPVPTARRQVSKPAGLRWSFEPSRRTHSLVVMSTAHVSSWPGIPLLHRIRRLGCANNAISVCFVQSLQHLPWLLYTAVRTAQHTRANASSCSARGHSRLPCASDCIGSLKLLVRRCAAGCRAIA